MAFETCLATASGHRQGSAARWRQALLTCGILAPVLYVAMTLFVGLLWEGYSIVSGVPSELSAIGAPTRPLWMWLGMVYAVLMIAFGWIVWTSASPNRALRVVGALLMVSTAFGQFWPPMHQRAVLAAGGGTLTDTLHLVWAMITGLFFVLIVGFGAAALGKRFRVYSIVTMVIGLACGAVTGTYASQVQADLPTPWVGVWERVSIAAFMAWIAVLASALLRAPRGAATADPSTSPSAPGRWARSVRATPQERTRAFVLEEAAHDSTRLIVRVRVGPEARVFGLPWWAANYLVSAIHFVMQRKQCIGIARRAELTMSRSSVFKTADRQAASAR